MSKITMKGSTLLAPLPVVMVSCGTAEKANIVTVAWTGIISSKPPKTYISLRQSRHSYNIIRESGEFVINVPSSALAKCVDFCGIYTGKKVDKFEKMRLTAIPSSEVSVPMISECPLNLECRVTDIVSLGSHDMFIADILAVNADDNLFDANNKLHLEKAELCSFAHGEYFSLGRSLGKFGFSAERKKKKNHNKHSYSNKKTD